MRDNPRLPLVSAALGLVLLGGVVGFAVVLPDLVDEPQATSAESGASDLGPIELPDELPGGFVAVDLGTLPEEVTGAGFDVQDVVTQQDSIDEGLEKTFGVPGKIRYYAAEDGSSGASITALDKAPGLFLVNAVPVDPAVVGLERLPSELVNVDGAVCEVAWGQPVAEGQPVDPTQTPGAVRCQIGEGERTYEVTGQGITLDATVAIAKSLVSS
ncbi:hypothetical protein ABFT23_12945 [Nocardioides sp. C4-1]|uniref:hypothetical protein n=1 Tax=Nocardioides sp. C4-1 TaxID=3151851 RepID=UPI0032633215